MFEPDPERTYLGIPPERVIDIYNSINRSSVAVPGKTPEPSDSYITMVHGEVENTYDFYIYLYLSVSNEGLLYRWDEGAVGPQQTNDLYQAAFEFTGAMGFMMDNSHYRDKSLDEKTEIHSRIPMFHADLSFLAVKKEEEEEEGADELLIESLDHEGKASPPEPEAEAEEINLDVLGDTGDISPFAEEEVTEISLDNSDVMLGAGSESMDEVKDALVDSPPPKVEDKKPTEEDIEEIDLGALDEQTIEAEPPPGAIRPSEPEAEESLLTSEEEKVLSGPEPSEVEEIDIGEESAPEDEEELSLDDSGPAPGDEDQIDISIEEEPPAAEPEPPPAKMAPPAPKPVPPPPAEAPKPAAAPVEFSSETDREILVRFLAMF